MSTVRVINRTRLREKPARTAALVRVLEHDEQLTPTGQRQVAADAAGTNEEWQEVKYLDVDADVTDIGWVLSNDVESAADVRPTVDRGGFVREAILAERVFNKVPTTAPWLVSANFIIARALIETDITNLGQNTPGSDAVGPLQVSTAEWKFLLDAGNVYGTFHDIQRESGITQIYGAALRMVRDAKAISELKTAALAAAAASAGAIQAPAAGAAPAPGAGPVPGAGPAQTDPFIPSMLDVFTAFLVDSAAAAVGILDASTSTDPAEQARPLDVVLGRSLSGPQITTVFTACSKYTGTSAHPKTVGEFVATVEADLNSALKKAFDLMKEHAPDELMQVSGTEASWFDVALEEEQKDVNESDPAKVKIILNYFGATSLGVQQRMLPWCGAFAAFCMQKSGNPVPAGAAAARSWKNWGVGLEFGSQDIPQGAVVVLSPSEGTGTTGHVAFFVELDPSGKTVQLLGGNQHDMLKRSSFPISKIAAIRWIDSAPAAAAEQFQASPSTTKISPEAIKLIIDSEVSSEEIYNKRYRGPTWPGLNSGVTVGIGYDVGQTTAAAVRSDWGGLVASGDITSQTLEAIVAAAGIKGLAARDRALALKAQKLVDVSYKAAMKVFSGHDIPRWTTVVERALGPNVSSLHPHCLGALVSLAYNRGASFARKGDRYKEMNAIKACVASRQFAGIPAQFRAMKRLWPNLKGLQIRRDAEADLFQRGLSAPPASPPPPIGLV